MMRYLMFAAFAALSLGACNDKGDDSAGGDDDDDDDDDVQTDDTGGGSGSGFTVSGNAVTLDGAAATEGLCVIAADPTPALSGGEMEPLANSTIGSGGAYSVEGIETNSTVGLLMLVQDCAEEGTVMPTATGLSSDSYSGLGDGDEISDNTIYSIDAKTAATFSAGLAYAGYTGDWETEGALLGFVFDSTGAPVDDAVITPSGGETVYYLGKKGFNTTGTVAAANSLFIIPGAAIGNYTCEATGETFDSLLVGSQPGYAVLIKFTAD